MEQVGATAQYDVFGAGKTLTVTNIPRVRPLINELIQQRNFGDIVLDLSTTEFVDSSAMRFLINISKQLSERNRALYLLRPSDAVRSTLCGVHLDRVFTIIESIHGVERTRAQSAFRVRAPHTKPESGLLRLKARCPLCGGTDVAGYLIDHDSYRWKWKEGDTRFPEARTREGGEPVDVFALMPVVCPDCLAASIDVSHFEVHDGSSTVIPSSLSEKASLALKKDERGRRETLKHGVVMGDGFFAHPRDRRCCSYAYDLVLRCAQELASAGDPRSGPFSIGEIAFHALRYAPEERADGLRDLARTYLSRAAEIEQRHTPLQLARAYFMLMHICRDLGKTADASGWHERLADLTQREQGAGADGFCDPGFWLEQSERVVRGNG